MIAEPTAEIVEAVHEKCKQPYKAPKLVRLDGGRTDNSTGEGGDGAINSYGSTS